MMESISDLLVNSLNELKKAQLKKFQWHLKNYGISAAELEDADVLDTVDKMLERFGPEKSVETTQDILRKMNQNHQAELLENKVQIRSGRPHTSSSSSSHRLGRTNKIIREVHSTPQNRVRKRKFYKSWSVTLPPTPFMLM